MGGSDEVVWAETADGAMLRGLFGFYPTLQDALVRSVALDLGAAHLSLTVDYADRVEDAELRVRIRLEWQGVRHADLPSDLRELFGVGFAAEGTGLRTHLDVGAESGTIVSDGFEAVLLAVDPLDDAPPTGPRWRIVGPRP